MTLLIFKPHKMVCHICHNNYGSLFVLCYLIWQLLGGVDEEESSCNSSFSFLHDQPDKNDSESDKSDNEQSSSFAFLNLSSASPQESQSKEKEKGLQLDKVDDAGGADVICSTAEPQTQPAEKQPQPTEKAESLNIRTRPLLKSPGGRTTGRQALPTGAIKKKKKKAFRPGGVQQTEQTDGEVPSITTSDNKLITVTTSEEKLVTTSEEELTTISQLDGGASSVFTSNVGKAPSVSEDDVEDTKHATSECQDASPNPNLVVKDDQVEEPVIDYVTMETKEKAIDNQAEPADITSTANLSTPAEGVGADSVAEPITLDTVEESHALEEVFCNYHIELSGEDSLAALLQSYESSIKKIRYLVIVEGREGKDCWCYPAFF